MTPQPRGEETRSRILDAASDCFSRGGYDATSVADICQAAGVTKGAFYYHFPTKQKVFVDLLNRWLANLDAQLAVARADTATVPEGIVRMAKMARHVFQLTDGHLQIFLEFWTKAARDPAIWQATIEPYRRYQTFLADIIKAGIAEGTLRRVNPEKAAQLMVSLAVGLILQSLLDPQGADWGRVAQDGIAMLLKGLEKRRD
jgi:AcrR family transcriptional regulator